MSQKASEKDIKQYVENQFLKQLKNKELLYKDNLIEIGSMGHREDNVYRLTCYLTPEFNTSLEDITIKNDDSIKVSYEPHRSFEIERKKQ